MSKVEGRVRLIPPPPIMPSCDLFYLMPSRVNKALHACGYPTWTIHKALLLKRPRESCETAPQGASVATTTSISIPYLKDTTEKIQRMIKSYQIRTHVKPIKKLRDIYVNQRIDSNPRMCVAQCTTSSVVVAKEKIVQWTMLERRREHSKHALPSTEDRAPPPLKCQNISTKITQSMTSNLKIRRYWIETPTDLPGESGRPSTPGPTNPP